MLTVKKQLRKFAQWNWQHVLGGCAILGSLGMGSHSSAMKSPDPVVNAYATPPAAMLRTTEETPKKNSKTLFGVASWYGRVLHGHHTASGERFDMFKMTAAHRDLPFGSMVRVKNLRNGRSVVVRINDRGEMGDGQIDLSYAAALKLKMVRSGIDQVELEILDGRPEIVLQAEARLK
jgi:rare lipoprotein A (peptidoglycan hydrolase)